MVAKPQAVVQGARPRSKEARRLRHRLRISLQELDLPPGDTLIGRSPECLITLEDPLVSRRHARIRIDEGSASFEDLGSRNGSRINGRIVTERTRLEEGDRIRIGALELVYCLSSDSVTMVNMPTGHLRQCGSCSGSYPEEVVACPSCGAVASSETDDTVSEVRDWRREPERDRRTGE